MTDDADSTAADQARVRELREQLEAAPVVEVRGIVAPSGVGGGWSQGDELWTLLLPLTVWRVGSGKLRARELTVRRDVTQEELRRFQAWIAAYTVLHIQARVVAKSVFGTPQALLERVVGVDESDSELNDQAAQLRMPVTFTDPMFGVFTLDREVATFDADVTWNGRPIRLTFSADDPDEIQPALQTARTLWQAQDDWRRRIEEFAVQELLPLKNDAWLDDDEEDLTAEQFRSRMTLEAISVDPEGSFDFWHNDGDLFLGHSIVIGGNLTDGPTDADIPG